MYHYLFVSKVEFAGCFITCSWSCFYSCPAHLQTALNHLYLMDPPSLSRFLYCHASGSSLTCCCSLGFCKCPWPSRRYKSIGSCKPWDPVLLFKGRILLILHFEWWQPNMNESRKQPVWNLVSSVTKARAVGWNRWRGERRARQSVLGCEITSKSWGLLLSTSHDSGMSWAVREETSAGLQLGSVEELRVSGDTNSRKSKERLVLAALD